MMHPLVFILDGYSLSGSIDINHPILFVELDFQSIGKADFRFLLLPLDEKNTLILIMGLYIL